MDSLGMIDDFGIAAAESHVEPQLLVFLLDQHTYVSAVGTRIFRACSVTLGFAFKLFVGILKEYRAFLCKSHKTLDRLGVCNSEVYRGKLGATVLQNQFQPVPTTRNRGISGCRRRFAWLCFEWFVLVDGLLARCWLHAAEDGRGERCDETLAEGVIAQIV